MKTFLSYSYNGTEEILTHQKILKLKSFWGEIVTYFCAVIFVDADQLESDRYFNPEHLGYIINIFDGTYDYRLRLWFINNYKEVTFMGS